MDDLRTTTAQRFPVFVILQDLILGPDRTPMGVGKPELFKQWKMMQDIDRILAEVATYAAAAGLDLESVREVLLANMLGEQPLPIDFRGKPPPETKAAPVRVIAE